MGTSEKHAVIIRSSTKIQFHNLRWKEDEGETIPVIRWNTDDGLFLNKDQFHVLKLLMKGKTVKEVAEITGQKLSEIRSAIDDFENIGFIRKIDNESQIDTLTKVRPLFSHLSSRWFRWLVGIPFVLISFIFIVSGFTTAFFEPTYIPVLDDFFWTNDYFLVLLTIHIIFLLVSFVHEAAHFITAKAVGAESRITLQTRFIYLTVVTEHYHLALVRKSLRYLVYISGMYADLILIACVMWILKLSDIYHFQLGIFVPILKSAVLLQIMNFAWEFNAFLETDVYNILSDYLNEDNLYVDTKKYIVGKIHKKSRHIGQLFGAYMKTFFYTKQEASMTDNFQALKKEEKKIIKWYAMYFVIGIISTSLFYFYFVFTRDFIIFTKSIQFGIETFHDSLYISSAKSFLTAFLVVDMYILTIMLIARRLKGRRQTV